MDDEMMVRCFLRSSKGGKLFTLDIANDALIEFPFKNLLKILKLYHENLKEMAEEAEADHIIENYPGY